MKFTERSGTLKSHRVHGIRRRLRVVVIRYVLIAFGSMLERVEGTVVLSATRKQDTENRTVNTAIELKAARSAVHTFKPSSTSRTVSVSVLTLIESVLG